MDGKCCDDDEDDLSCDESFEAVPPSLDNQSSPNRLTSQLSSPMNTPDTLNTSISSPPTTSSSTCGPHGSPQQVAPNLNSSVDSSNGPHSTEAAKMTPPPQQSPTILNPVNGLHKQYQAICQANGLTQQQATVANYQMLIQQHQQQQQQQKNMMPFSFAGKMGQVNQANMPPGSFSNEFSNSQAQADLASKIPSLLSRNLAASINASCPNPVRN